MMIKSHVCQKESEKGGRERLWKVFDSHGCIITMLDDLYVAKILADRIGGKIELNM